MSNKIDNFKGKRHTFTPEERAKGRKKKTDKRKFNSQTNAIKKGGKENTLKDCNSCHIPFCPLGEDNNSCTLFNTKFVRLVMFKQNMSSIREFDDFIFDFLIRGSEAQKSDSSEIITKFIYDLLELQEWKHESIR